MEYVVVDNEEGFLSLRDTWNGLLEKMIDATPFQTWEWNYYFWKHRERDAELMLIVAWENRKTFGIAPLVNKNGVISFIGGSHIDYGGFILGDYTLKLARGFMTYITKIPHRRIELQEMSSRWTQLHILKQMYDDNSRVFFRQTTRTVLIPVSTYVDWKKYYATLDRKFKSKNRLQDLENGKLKLVFENLDAVTANNIIEIYSQRQEQRVGDSNIKWAIPMINDLQAEGIVTIAFLRDSNTDVVASFGIVLKFNGRHYLWLSAVDPRIGRNSGHLLYCGLIRNALELGLDEFDMLRGDYDYKMRWNPEVYTNYTFVFYNRSFVRVFAELKYRLRRVFRNSIYGNKKILSIWVSISKYLMKDRNQHEDSSYLY